MIVVVIVIFFGLIHRYDEKGIINTRGRATQIYNNFPVLVCAGRQVPWIRRNWRSWMKLEKLLSVLTIYYSSLVL